jgi:hypothetical protein
MIDEEIKDDMVHLLETIFISGKTYAFVVWLMFLVGIVLGALIW